MLDDGSFSSELALGPWSYGREAHGWVKTKDQNFVLVYGFDWLRNENISKGFGNLVKTSEKLETLRNL